MSCKTVDLVVPCYNEEEILNTFYTETAAVIEKIQNNATEPKLNDSYQFHFILVNDGSRDRTLSIMRDLSAAHEEVDYISFSRNFGKEAAMYAGFTYSTADLVVVMDADLQHPPQMFSEFLAGIEEGYDCVAARRTDRKGESHLRNLLSLQFYKFSNSLTEVQLIHGVVDYRIMTRQMIDAILSLSEHQRFSKGIFAWVGFDTKWVPYENVERTMGQTKWSIKSLFNYAIDGIIAFSVKPLKWITGFGIALMVFSLLYILLMVILHFAAQVILPAYFPTLSAVCLIGGIIECSLGVIAEYLSRIYISAKDRPLYITKETSMIDENSKLL